MRVLLRLSWFGPNGVLYEKNAKGTEIPDEFCRVDEKGKFKLLPSLTKPFDAAQPVAEPKPQTLRDADGERAASDAEGQVRELALLESAVAGAKTPEEKKTAMMALKRYQLQAQLAKENG